MVVKADIGVDIVNHIMGTIKGKMVKLFFSKSFKCFLQFSAIILVAFSVDFWDKHSAASHLCSVIDKYLFLLFFKFKYLHSFFTQQSYIYLHKT